MKKLFKLLLSLVVILGGAGAVFAFPDVSDTLSPALNIVVLQLLAYYIAEYLGKDVDQPRNLAKSVTVE